MKQVHDGELGDLIEGRVLWSNAWGPLYRWLGLRERSGDWMVEQAVHNWDVMNWANRCLPVRALGMGRDDLFRNKQPERNVHDYYAGMMQYQNGVLVNIIHSWMAPGKFNDEYTRLIGSKGGIDFNSGTFSYRPDSKKPDRVGHTQKGEINSTLLALQNFLTAVRTHSQPVATVQHGRDSVVACLLMRQAVYTRRMIELKEIVG
jgi:predicted dehydrogenase